MRALYETCRVVPQAQKSRCCSNSSKTSWDACQILQRSSAFLESPTNDKLEDTMNKQNKHLYFKGLEISPTWP